MSRVLPQFGSYEAIRRLGAGGMAETFVAVRRGPGGFEQKVCIKRVLPAYAEDREFIEAFLREARTSAALRHANIVQVLDFGEADDSYYLALELIDGLDLRALVVAQEDHQRRRLSAEVVTLIAGELAAALEHAHGAGPDREPVVHRDLSPSNVLVSPAGEVKLTDFGIARALGGIHLTATGVIKGKVPYLPPEYVARGLFDQRSDLFSLGVLLFELLAGERPFDGESDLDTIRRIASGERPNLRDLAPQVPQPLAACIDRLIAVAPEARFDSARAFLEALPPVSTHPARRELGSLVEARMRATQRISSRIPTRPAAQSVVEDPGQARTLTAEPVANGFPPVPSLPPMSRQRSAAITTRTRRPLPSRSPARRKRRALAVGLAAAALIALLLGVALKEAKRFAGAHSVAPPPPTSSASAQAPTPVPKDARPVPVVPDSPVSAPRPAAAVEAGPRRDDTTVSGEKPARGAASADIRVVVLPFGDVWVDGKPLGHAPVTVKMSPGPHEIGVGDGRPEQRRSVQLHAAQHENLIFRRDSEAR